MNNKPDRLLSGAAAINETIHEAMDRDQSVIIIGEDIAGGAGLGGKNEGAMGGSFGVTKGLLESFGPQRVRDTPISEAAIAGVAIGAAAAGLRPIVDMMWSSFTPLAFDQILNQAAKMRYMFGGQARIPVVLRMAMGAGLGAAGQHSDTLYSIFTHIPGLKVVVPSCPSDAKGLLAASIADDNPVLFFEHMGLYGMKEAVPTSRYQIPLGKAKVVREGQDITIVGISMMVQKALEAATRLEEIGIKAEVIDPRTLSPIDDEAIFNSVRKTGRLLIVDESPPRCSIATDISARVSEAVYDALKAPIKRITSPHTPVPLSPPLEAAYIPSVEKITSIAENLIVER
jgi:pyruvate/2-oxoglutarate/acetoin dehydrogenase E1 component